MVCAGAGQFLWQPAAGRAMVAMVGAIGTRKLVPFLHDVLKAPLARNLGGIVAVFEKASLDHRSKICTDADDAD